MRLVTSSPVSSTTRNANITPSPGRWKPSRVCGWYRVGSSTSVRSISVTTKLMTQMVAMIGSQTRMPATSNRRRLTGRLPAFTARGSSATTFAGLGFGFDFRGRLACRRLGGRLCGRPGRLRRRGLAGRAAGSAAARARVTGAGLLSGFGFGVAVSGLAVSGLSVAGRGVAGLRVRRGCLARLGVRPLVATRQIALGFLVGLEIRFVPAATLQTEYRRRDQLL